jgi:hypothetical protein
MHPNRRPESRSQMALLRALLQMNPSRYLNRSQVTVSHRTCWAAWWRKVTNTNIVHCDGDCKSKVRLHAETHLPQTFDAVFSAIAHAQITEICTAMT